MLWRLKATVCLTARSAKKKTTPHYWSLGGGGVTSELWTPSHSASNAESISLSGHHRGNVPWWRHPMETFSALLAICAGTSPVIGEFPAKRPVAQSFEVFFDLRLNKRLSKQPWDWWIEAPSRPLWRHRNVINGLTLGVRPWDKAGNGLFVNMTP